jgi:hypothetical protein
MTFAGEERGLLGSNYFVNHPTVPLNSIVGMINMDMIGRVNNNHLNVLGVGTSPEFKSWIEEFNKTVGFQINYSASGHEGSDHISFDGKHIPILFFFSGLHSDYHRPSDTWDKIDAPDAVQLLDMIADVTDHLTDGAARPQFVRVADPENPHSDVASSHSSGTVSGYGPDFGSIPDFTELPNGVRFADVRPGSPAAKAGFKAGDVLIEFDGKKIQNLYDFTYALRAEKPGQEVLVKVLRGDQTIEAKVLLTERK